MLQGWQYKLLEEPPTAHGFRYVAVGDRVFRVGPTTGPGGREFLAVSGVCWRHRAAGGRAYPLHYGRDQAFGGCPAWSSEEEETAIAEWRRVMEGSVANPAMCRDHALRLYRRDILRALKRDANFLLEEANEVLTASGLMPPGSWVEGLWIIGSVLKPKMFTRESDVDIAVRVRTVGREVRGMCEDCSKALAGRLAVEGSALDASVWFNMDPAVTPRRRIA